MSSIPRVNALPNASIEIVGQHQVLAQAISGPDGQFVVKLRSSGEFVLKAEAPGFRPVVHPITVRLLVILRSRFGWANFRPRIENVTVTADVNETDVLSPDPGEKVFVRQDLLDANPGRPGAPVSIPGYPIETASSGIKAPQYFAPGVAGDHGEPIAQYIAVGSYLVPNNLSANAHGNGYSDPNIFIPEILESVQVDGGAFNVREGNHSVNLAATYGFRSRLDPFITLTGDYRDLDVVAGLSPSPILGWPSQPPMAMDSSTGWNIGNNTNSMANDCSTLASTGLLFLALVTTDFPTFRDLSRSFA